MAMEAWGFDFNLETDYPYRQRLGCATLYRGGERPVAAGVSSPLSAIDAASLAQATPRNRRLAVVRMDKAPGDLRVAPRCPDFGENQGISEPMQEILERGTDFTIQF